MEKFRYTVPLQLQLPGLANQELQNSEELPWVNNQFQTIARWGVPLLSEAPPLAGGYQSRRAPTYQS